MATATATRTRRALLFPQPIDHLVGTSLEGGLFEIQKARIIQIPVNDEGSTLDEMHERLGGYIEAVLMPLDHSGYINEEGKLTSPPLPLNTEADTLWRRALREDGRVSLRGDYLGGPVVVTGPVDEEGYDTDVTDKFIELVRSMAIQIEET